MSYRGIGCGSCDASAPVVRGLVSRPQLGQWELIGSAAAASGASYGTLLWGESSVSDFFGTIYGQVITTALNAVGSIWGIPLGSIVEGIAEMFGGLFGGGKSHAQREAEELARTVGNLRLYVAQIQKAPTLTALYNVLCLWSSRYVGGSCPGPTANDHGSVPQCIAIQVRPLLYAPPDVQPVTKGGAGASVPGGARGPANAYGYLGLPAGTDLRTLTVDHWPWVMTGYTGKPSAWYATVSETGFFRALLDDPVKRFHVGVQQGVTASKLVPLNQQIADAVRGAAAKIIQRDYGPAIKQAIAIAEAVHAGVLPTDPQTVALMQKAGIAPGVVPTEQQVRAVMAPAVAASPGVNGGGSLLPLLLGGVAAWFYSQGGTS